MSINVKRIYEAPDSEDGVRILVDRIWPRGVSKEKAALDYWLKDIAPSRELRQWFAHDPEKFEVFKEKYKDELTSGDQQQALKKLQGVIKSANKGVTLLYGAKDKTHNQAVALKEVLDNK